MSKQAQYLLWCVGLCLLGGQHKFKVFDDYEEARKFKRLVNGGTYNGVSVIKVVMWEM